MQYQFRGQHRSEEVLLICRQHPLVLMRGILWAGLIFLIPILVGDFWPVGGFLAGSIAICLVVGVILLITSYYSWWNTLFLLTNERVVLLDQRGPVNRQFAEANLGAVLQVVHEIKGIFPTLFGYGSISIYTGGAQIAFIVQNLPDPYDIQQEIQAAVVGELPE